MWRILLAGVIMSVSGGDRKVLTGPATKRVSVQDISDAAKAALARIHSPRCYQKRRAQ